MFMFLFSAAESHISVAQRINKELPRSIILDQVLQVLAYEVQAAVSVVAVSKSW